MRAFGVVEHPDWADFQYFLEDRCFPKTRDHAKEILRELGVPFYDPLLIIEKTKGRMEGDHQWILILKKDGMQMKQMNLDAYSPLHKTGHTSKGDQRKENRSVVV